MTNTTELQDKITDLVISLKQKHGTERQETFNMIGDLLTSEKASLLEEVGKKLPKQKEYIPAVDIATYHDADRAKEIRAYNNCIDQVTTLLNTMKGEIV
jgi:hypothetical protein